MISAPVHDFVSRAEFHDGMQWGCALAGVGVAAGVVSITVFRRPAPVAGLLVTVAFVQAMKHTGGLPANTTRGLVYLAVAGLAAGLLSAWWRPLAFSGMAFAIPGASLLTHNTGLPDVSWVAPLVVVTVVVGGTLVADFDRRHRQRGWPVVMYAVSVVGVYFTVPDTERALVLLGAALPMLLLGWPVALASLGTAGSYPAVGALAWIAAFEGLGRRTAIVGGVACLGLFTIEPMLRLLKRLSSRRWFARRGPTTVFDRLPDQWWVIVPVVATHLLLVVVASRVAGLRTQVRAAATIAILDLVVGLVILLLIDGEIRRIRPPRHRRSVENARR